MPDSLCHWSLGTTRRSQRPGAPGAGLVLPTLVSAPQGSDTAGFAVVSTFPRSRGFVGGRSVVGAQRVLVVKRLVLMCCTAASHFPAQF